MRLADVQNLYGKTLDAQALMQQAVSASDLAARHAAAALAQERRRKEAQIAESEGSARNMESRLELERGPDPEKSKRPPRLSLGGRIDIKA